MCGCIQTEAWWFCGTCKKPVVRNSEKNAQQILQAHKSQCPQGMFRIRYVYRRGR